MADRLTEKKEAAKKDEAYQPLWDTDQSIPEYMALLMDQQASEQEDAELHEASDSEDSDGSNEPEDTSEDTHENEVENQPVALASAQSTGPAQPVLSARERAQVMQAQTMQAAQAMQTQTTHAYGEYVRLESLGLSPGAILPVIPDPLFGTPDSKLIEMRLLDRSHDESAPMQACATHLNPVKAEENPVSRAAMLQPVGYVPINNPLAGTNIEEIESQRTFWKTVLIVLLILNPFVLVPLVSMFDSSAGMSMLFFFIIIGLGSFLVVPILWIVGIVQAVKHKNRLRELIQKTKTTHAEFWYYLVYNRLPDGYTGVNGFTKEEEDSFSVYEFLKKQEHAKLHEAAAQREASALQKRAAHPALADEEKQG
ncbi:pyruvate ferredoxin oxidoreductase [uncultured Rothia sp.]|uniref:pyruvate ferredoxin oxidoreductase n=1 Tax=uncultured Rothia sp. TaxID=316088 RepID=UPI0025DCFF51|nr:pyruvate ferredoxin oxidoreductase [uncultured Rothia sp.]